MTVEVVRVEGLQEFLRALSKADKQTKKLVRGRLRDAAEGVKQGAIERFMPYAPSSARKYRVVVRQRGISVEQPLRRTTGKHPDFGALQMRKALVPSLEDNEDKIVDEIRKAAEDIAEIIRRA